VFRNANNVFKVWPHSLDERTQISMLSNSWVSILSWTDVTAAVVVWFVGHRCKNHNSGVSSLLSYGAIFKRRIIYKCCSRKRVGHP